MRRLLFILVACSGCVKQPLYSGKPFPATALVNNGNWYGAPQAVTIPQDSTAYCTVNKFLLFIRTDLPYQAGSLLSKQFRPVTGCLDECIPSQLLSIENIPLKKGKYKIRKLDKCGTIMFANAHHTLVLPLVGSGVVNSYRCIKHKPNWIRITNYDKQSNSVEGRFALRLEKVPGKRTSDSTVDVVTIRDGRFKARLQRSLQLEGTPKN